MMLRFSLEKETPTRWIVFPSGTNLCQYCFSSIYLSASSAPLSTLNSNR